MKLSLSLLLFFVAVPAAAQLRLPLQGNIQDDGVPLSGPVDMLVRVFDAEDIERACEAFTDVPLVGGTFNVLLGDTLNDCGAGAPTSIDASIFLLGPASVQVTLNGAVFVFPTGDAPSAGVAELCTSAQLLEGFTAADFLGHPRFHIVEDDDQLTAALTEAAAEANANNPFVIELGPEIFTGGFTVPASTIVRGQAPEISKIQGEVVVSSGAHLRDLTVQNTLGSGVVVRAPGGTPVELANLRVIGVGNGLLIDEGGATTSVTLRDSRVSASGAVAVGISDLIGVELNVIHSTVDAAGDTAFAVRVGTPAAPTGGELELRLTSMKSKVNVGAGLGAGIEVNAVGGLVRIVDANVRVLGASGRAITVNSGEARVNHSLFFADIGLFTGAGAGLRLFGTGLDAFSGALVDAASGGGIACNNSYNEAAFAALNPDCTLP